MREFPLISCVCITYNRTNLLYRAILAFDSQTYPNKELIISFQDNDVFTNYLVLALELRFDLKIIKVLHSDRDSLGTVRNNAFNNCNGMYICIWDDDDLHGVDRLLLQFLSLQNGYYEGSLLTRIILFESGIKKAFRSYQTYWAGTILCKKEILLKFPCDDTNDLEFLPLITYSKSTSFFQYLDYFPELYIFTYHGSNLMNYRTFLSIVSDSSEVMPDVAAVISKQLSGLQIDFQNEFAIFYKS
jgi:glycosyltransferase involved in cell wall biosynthesis